MPRTSQSPPPAGRRPARAAATPAPSGNRLTRLRRSRPPKPEREGPGTLGRLKQAYEVAHKHDRYVLVWPALGFLVPLALGIGLGFALNRTVLLPILGLVLGLALGANLFSSRAQRGIYAEAADTPGAALQVVRQMRGDWKITEAVQFTRQQDFVHRVVGRPGVVLIGEGRPAAVRDLMAAESRRTRRVSPDTPLHEIVIGQREGATPLAKVRPVLTKMPRTLRGPQIQQLDVKLKAVANSSLPIPKGPMPTRMPRGKMR